MKYRFLHSQKSVIDCGYALSHEEYEHSDRKDETTLLVIQKVVIIARRSHFVVDFPKLHSNLNSRILRFAFLDDFSHLLRQFFADDRL